MLLSVCLSVVVIYQYDHVIVCLSVCLSVVVIYQYDHGTERHDLPMDKAALVFFNKLTTGNLSIQQVSSDCYRVRILQKSFYLRENFRG